MSGPLVECVPNFSEGTDARRVEAIVAAMQVDGVRLLDWSMDADHNRSVVTIAGDPAAVVEAAVRGAGKAAELIDLTRQQGVHPRIGAADVIPFVPISGIKLEQCALLARQAGLEIWRRFNVPVFFYEAAAARPDRANLEEVSVRANSSLLTTSILIPQTYRLRGLSLARFVPLPEGSRASRPWEFSPTAGHSYP